MSVWAHVGAVEFCRVWVFRLWFKKTTRIKGPRAGREGKESRLQTSKCSRGRSLVSKPASAALFSATTAIRPGPKETQARQPLPLPPLVEDLLSRSYETSEHMHGPGEPLLLFM